MWVRKSIRTIIEEQRDRRKKARTFAVVLIVLSCLWLAYKYTTIESIKSHFIADPEGFLVFLLLPVFVASMYRSYVLYGSAWSFGPGRRCLHCERSWHHSNDGWGFMSLGKNKPKWYQVSSCKTPELCDIAMDHEVRWEAETDESPNKRLWRQAPED